MEHFWNLLFQLMKHGTNTLHVVFLFSILWCVQIMKDPDESQSKYIVFAVLHVTSRRYSTYCVLVHNLGILATLRRIDTQEAPAA